MAPNGWVNYDASPTLKFERIPILGKIYTKNSQRFPKNVKFGDIIRGLPHEKSSVQGIFCSHVLEHLSLEDCRKALRNTFEYLKPGGIFRLVVPDLEHALKEYEKDKSPEASIHFMENTLLGKSCRRGIMRQIIECVFGNSKHLWMWDEKSMKKELLNAGFFRVRRAEYGDSPDPRFKEVENEDRFLNCLALEAEKK
ncbi:MAG: methyltransferase domain-containing protein [Proteobacteria bacterium]|nr:methyltransferase domain-containing protein [Pseudomonadota bacterium]